MYGGDVFVGLVFWMDIVLYCCVFCWYVESILFYGMEYIEFFGLFVVCDYIFYGVVVYMIYMDVV